MNDVHLDKTNENLIIFKISYDRFQCFNPPSVEKKKSITYQNGVYDIETLHKYRVL